MGDRSKALGRAGTWDIRARGSRGVGPFPFRPMVRGRCFSSFSWHRRNYFRMPTIEEAEAIRTPCAEIPSSEQTPCMVFAWTGLSSSASPRCNGAYARHLRVPTARAIHMPTGAQEIPIPIRLVHDSFHGSTVPAHRVVDERGYQPMNRRWPPLPKHRPVSMRHRWTEAQ